MTAPGCVSTVRTTAARRAKCVRAFTVLTAAAAVMTVATLLIPGRAQAHRAPTARERAEIAREVARGVRKPAYRIKMRHIEVSRLGPFATASFAVEFKKGEKPVPGNATL